jgi:tetratricopeptide (TPR) repeat protein
MPYITLQLFIMKRIFYIITIALISISFLSCDKKIVNQADYLKYLTEPGTPSPLSKIDEEIKFWNSRLKQTPDDIIARAKFAGLLTRRFSYSGNIREVLDADSLYKLVNALNRINSSGTYRSLAANCITRHQFQQAKLYIDSALQLGDDKYISILMQFDVAMELGNYQLARQSLRQLAGKSAFEYLIREAKYKDHAEGNLEEAIFLMEAALAKIKDGSNRDTYCWTKSNLGDMYGHANRFKDAYNCYLEVLAIDPAYYHCLKGIAWLAFSHDKNTSEAKKILTFLKQQHPVPDYDLLLAEIAQFENDSRAANRYISQYTEHTKNPLYGGMYNKYNFNLAADEFKDYKEALRIAESEIQNRPTPESYQQLAWVYFKKGDLQQALNIANARVDRHCFEPAVLYRIGIIYQAAGNKKKGMEYLEKASDSWFELGPAVAAKIDRALNGG